MNGIKRYKLVATESARNVIECDDGHWVHYSNVEQLQARIKELESENQQTEMTVHEAQEYAWEMVKIDCGLHHITVGELSVYYAFFLHGWNYATQYHKQTNKKIINEIKAQGIEEAIKKADGETYIYPVGTDALNQQYRAELKCYAETLSNNYEVR